MQTDKQKSRKKIGHSIRVAALIVPLICALFFFSQTVLAQNTYVITDGSRVLVHTTSVTDPDVVLDEAGLELDADDSYTTERGNGISAITVRRGEPTVTLSPTVFQTETYTQCIPHKTAYCSDSSLPAGTQKVLTEGMDGQMLCRASVVYDHGEEVSRTILDQTVLDPPTDELVALGTGPDQAAGYVPDLPVISDGTIITPTGEVLTYTGVLEVTATAYTCNGYLGITATGTYAREGAIAVDPKVIPYGTRMYIVTKDGSYIYGVATAEDCGGAIQGKKVDLYYNTESECWAFGRRECLVYILG